MLTVRSMHVGCSRKCRKGSAAGGPDKCSGCQRCAVISGGRYWAGHQLLQGLPLSLQLESSNTADSLSELNRSSKHQETTDAPLTNPIPVWCFGFFDLTLRSKINIQYNSTIPHVIWLRYISFGYFLQRFKKKKKAQKHATKQRNMLTIWVRFQSLLVLQTCAHTH